MSGRCSGSNPDAAFKFPHTLFQHRSALAAVLVSLVAISGSYACTRSPLSSEMIDDFSLLHPDITLTRTIRRQASGTVTRQTSIRAVIRDGKGRAIENSGVDVHVNGASLPFKVATGNYYDRTPFYQRADTEGAVVQPSTLYVFSIRLENGREAEVGRIITQPDLTATNLTLPLTHASDQPLAIAWKGIAPGSWFVRRYLQLRGTPASTTLVVRRMVETIGAESQASMTQPPGDDGFQQDVKDGEGVFTVPPTYFNPAGARATDVIVELRSTSAARISSPFSDGSLVAIREAQAIIPLTK
jgi:hypothetical protein